MRRPAAPLPLLVLLLAAVLAAGACSPTYVMRAAWEEAKILHRREPIARIIADPRTDPVTRAKLQLVLEARAYAKDTLGLNAGQSYTLFSEVHSDTLAMVLSAARKDRFEAHTWWFPIVGRVPYKGFFELRDAEREAAKLEREGFDTYVRPTAAFSTLGYFTDPLLSTLLRYDSLSLANTVVHEILHNEVYLSGQAMWNESFANFVGARGAIDFFCAREGEAGPGCRRARAEWEDDRLFGRFMSDVVERLEAVYDRPDLAREAKLAERERIFDDARRRFREELTPQLKVNTFASFERTPLNNATLISRRLYYGRLDLFEQVYESRGRDLRRTITDVLAAVRADRKDPYGATEALLGPGRGL